MSGMNRLVIIDGNAIMHRAYHALPPMRNQEGLPTNAVYGFTSMLLRLIGDIKPTHLTVVFDRPAPTFRKKLYADYQSKRPKMDEDLSVQIDLVHEVVDSFGIPIYEKDGYEADDVIGTIATQIGNEHTHGTDADSTRVDQTIIVTGDRDILQLVTDRVLVFMPVRGLTKSKLYGVDETEKKLGVPPRKVIDLKALSGDSSDNYPGVAGIGPKTAKTLLDTYGTLEAVYTAAEKDGDVPEMRESVRKKLLDGKDDAFLSRELATIHTAVPIQFSVEKSLLDDLDTARAHGALERFGFYSLIARLSSVRKSSKSVKESDNSDKESKKPTSTQQSLF